MPEISLISLYRQTRQQSLLACAPLCTEDYGLQAQAFTSPPKWHLAHTSWFFETFLLKPFLRDYQTPDEHYESLFNSYYNSVGQQFSRAQRGLLSRPTVEAVRAYREHVDLAMEKLLHDIKHPQRDIIQARSRLGIEHEQQHQELFYTDLKFSLHVNPLLPAYTAAKSNSKSEVGCTPQPQEWREYEGGLISVGCDAPPASWQEFSFDNEGPANSVYLGPYALARRLVTNAQFQEFVDDDGYRRPEFWLADGWTVVQEMQWKQPLYWLQREGVPRPRSAWVAVSP